MRPRLSILVLLLAAPTGCGPGTPATTPGSSPTEPPDPAKAAELRWAREVADSFLRAVVARESAEAIALTTAAYRKRYQQPTDAEDAARFRLEHRVYGREVKGLSTQELEPLRFVTWAEEAGAIAPGQDEAVFRGTLSGPVRKAAYSLTVVKEGGKWRVDTFVVPVPKE